MLSLKHLLEEQWYETKKHLKICYEPTFTTNYKLEL